MLGGVEGGDGEDGGGGGEEREEEEREEVGGGDAGEERAVQAAEDLRGGGVDACGAQELQLLGLALHGGWMDLWIGWRGSVEREAPAAEG